MGRHGTWDEALTFVSPVSRAPRRASPRTLRKCTFLAQSQPPKQRLLPAQVHALRHPAHAPQGCLAQEAGGAVGVRELVAEESFPYALNTHEEIPFSLPETEPSSPSASFSTTARPHLFEHLAGAIARSYVPVILLLVLRSTFLSLSLSPSARVVALSLAAIAPELRHSARSNLVACARASRRRPSRLGREIAVHGALTLLAASATLGACALAVVMPLFGAFLAMMSQAAFAYTRRVRFERLASAYRCHPLHYREIGVVCALATLLVYCVQCAWAEIPAAIGVALLCAGYWLVKWTFVAAE